MTFSAVVLMSLGAWGATTGRTAQSHLLEVGAGWPGVYARYGVGVSDRVELGARVAFQYGYEGFFSTVPGGKAQVVLRVQLAQSRRSALALTVAPGAMFYAAGSPLVGVTVPVGLAWSFVVGPSTELAVLFELPVWMRVSGSVNVIFPLLGGLSVEHHMTESVGLFIRARGGPSFATNGGAPVPTLHADAGVAVQW